MKLPLIIYPGKAYLRHHGVAIRLAEDPVQVLYDSLGCVTAEMAQSWIQHAGYTFDLN